MLLLLLRVQWPTSAKVSSSDGQVVRDVTRGSLTTTTAVSAAPTTVVKFSGVSRHTLRTPSCLGVCRNGKIATPNTLETQTKNTRKTFSAMTGLQCNTRWIKSQRKHQTLNQQPSMQYKMNKSQRKHQTSKNKYITIGGLSYIVQINIQKLLIDINT